jgi:hypothetical protein
LWAALLLSAALVPIVSGEPQSAPKDPQPNVQPLIEQLGDPDFRKRDEAVEKLRALGVPVVPALRKALGHRDPEVRRRLHDLIPSLETAAILAPKRVTLKMSDKTLREVFDEIQRQAGYRIEFWGTNTAQPYSFEFKDLTFWQAIDRISREAGLVLQQHYGDDVVRLHQQQGHVPYLYHDGAFRFMANNFQHYRNIELGLVGQGTPGRRSETLTFAFTVFSEPKLPLLGMGEVRLTAAYDADKNSMLVPVDSDREMMEGPWGFRRFGVSRYGNGNRCFSMQTQVNLNRPSEKATRVKVLRGTIPVTLLVEQKPIVVTDNILKAKGKTIKVGTTTFLFEDVTALANKQYQLKLSVSEENKDNPNDYTWMNTLYQRIELHDEKGQKYQVYSSSWGNSGPTNVQMTLTYSAQGNALTPPSKFIFQQWTSLQHQIHFEFTDLPLP